MIDRRRFMIGGVSLATLGTMLPRKAFSAGSDRYLVIYWNDGGWDPSFVFDPHFESKILERGSGAEQAEAHGLSYNHAKDRPAVQNFLETWGDQAAFINGIGVGSISHDLCSRLMLTGTRALSQPDLPTQIASATGGGLALPHLVLSGPRFPGSLGASMVPLSSLLVETIAGTEPAASSYDAEVESLTRDWLATEAERVGSTDYAQAMGRLASVEDDVEQLEISEDADEEELLESGLQAISLGMSRCIILQGSLPGNTTWDSHQTNEAHQNNAFEHSFDRLSDLMNLLNSYTFAAGGSLLDKTTVLVLSEMGRTPTLNSEGGKDHWPYTSAMLLGAGVNAGQVFGATDEALVGQPIDLSSGEAYAKGELLSPAHLIAGVLRSFDIDPESHLPGVTPLTAPFE